MNALGRHILAEIYGCDAAILNNRNLIEKIMVESALEAGAEVREVAFHKFSPQGVSGVVVILNPIWQSIHGRSWDMPQ